MANKTTRTTSNVNATVADADKALALQAFANEHADAIKLGMALRDERENRASQAKSLSERPDFLEKLRAIVQWMDSLAFAECLDFRQAQGHRAAVTLVTVINDAIALRDTDATSAAYEHAIVVVHGQVALLAQRAPSSVRSNPEASFALQGYMSMLRGMRGVELPMLHTTDATKLAAIREQQAQRAQRQLDAVNALRAMLPAKTVDAD